MCRDQRTNSMVHVVFILSMPRDRCPCDRLTASGTSNVRARERNFEALSGDGVVGGGLSRSGVVKDAWTIVDSACAVWG